jgi:hypothetical protein
LTLDFTRIPHANSLAFALLYTVVSVNDLPRTQDIFLLEHEVRGALMLLLPRRCVMNKLQVLSGLACVSVLLATGVFAEILGVQPGTSDNPKDNVPAKIQRDGGAFSPGDSGPGQRDDALVGMKKEKPESATRQELEQNVQDTHGGGAALAAEDLKDKSKNTLKKGVKSKEPREAAGASDTGNSGPKTDRQMFRQQNSDSTAQGQQLINEQPSEKQRPANRPASERGAGQK